MDFEEKFPNLLFTRRKKYASSKRSPFLRISTERFVDSRLNLDKFLRPNWASAAHSDEPERSSSLVVSIRPREYHREH